MRYEVWTWVGVAQVGGVVDEWMRGFSSHLLSEALKYRRICRENGYCSALVRTK